jgi:hypothetical protein
MKYLTVVKGEGENNVLTDHAFGDEIMVCGIKMFVSVYPHGKTVWGIDGYKTIVTEAKTGKAVFYSKRLLKPETARNQAEEKVFAYGVKNLQADIEKTRAEHEKHGIPFPLNG